MIFLIHSYDTDTKTTKYPDKQSARKAMIAEAEQIAGHPVVDENNEKVYSISLTRTGGKTDDSAPVNHSWDIIEVGPAAILVWSDGCEINYTMFYTEQEAVDHMHKEYDDHVSVFDADDLKYCERGENKCYAAPEGGDACVWTVITL